MLTVNWRGQSESQLCSWYFNRQRLESQGGLEDEGTKRTTTCVLNTIQNVPETAIHLKADEKHAEPQEEARCR